MAHLVPFGAKLRKGLPSKINGAYLISYETRNSPAFFNKDIRKVWAVLLLFSGKIQIVYDGSVVLCVANEIQQLNEKLKNGDLYVARSQICCWRNGQDSVTSVIIVTAPGFEFFTEAFSSFALHAEGGRIFEKM